MEMEAEVEGKGSREKGESFVGRFADFSGFWGSRGKYLYYYIHFFFLYCATLAVRINHEPVLCWPRLVYKFSKLWTVGQIFEVNVKKVLFENFFGAYFLLIL